MKIIIELDTDRTYRVENIADAIREFLSILPEQSNVEVEGNK